MRNPSTSREDRVPADPKGFDEAVRREAARRAFRLVAQDVRGTLDENPDHLTDLRRFLREGPITDAGDTASATLRDAKDRRSSSGRPTTAGTSWTESSRRRNRRRSERGAAMTRAYLRLLQVRGRNWPDPFGDRVGGGQCLPSDPSDSRGRPSVPIRSTRLLYVLDGMKDAAVPLFLSAILLAVCEIALRLVPRTTPRDAH